MNRITSYVAPKISERPKDQPQECSFCGGSMDKVNFRAISNVRRDIAICQNCVEKYALHNKAVLPFLIYFKNKPWGPFKSQLERVLNAERGSVKMKRVALDICLALHKRNAQLAVEGSLLDRPPRIVLSGKKAKDMFPLLKAGLEFGGTICCHSSDGKMTPRAVWLGGNTPDHLRCTMVFMDRYMEMPEAPYAITYAVETTQGLRAICVDGFDKSELH